MEFSIFPLDKDCSFSGYNEATQTNPTTNAGIRNQREINKTSSSEIAGQRSHFISISAHFVVRREHQRKTFDGLTENAGSNFNFVASNCDESVDWIIRLWQLSWDHAGEGTKENYEQQKDQMSHSLTNGITQGLFPFQPPQPQPNQINKTNSHQL